jgi:hypothetical protein
MMGRSHSLSGAGIFLVGSAVYQQSTQTPIDPAVLVMGTIVFAGAALAPDMDSYTATVTKSFSFVGRILYYLANMIGLFFYNITKTKYDEPKTNGHRTFFHTGISAILMGGLVGLATAAGGSTLIFGKEFSWGEIFALIIMAFCLHVALAGIFQTQLKKAKTGIGPFILAAASLTVTVILSRFLPDPDNAGTYAWLGLAFGGGWLVHILGDLITKMGVPLFWPLKIKGHRWYDVSLPSFMRIEAGGTFEKVFLVPLFYVMIFGGAMWNALIMLGVIK